MNEHCTQIIFFQMRLQPTFRYKVHILLLEIFAVAVFEFAVKCDLVKQGLIAIQNLSILPSLMRSGLY